MDTLARRLSGRGTDDHSVINRRLREAHEQLSAAGTFDCIVINDDLASAHDQFQAIIIAELLRTKRHSRVVAKFRDS
jgi:guanylate kinase